MVGILALGIAIAAAMLSVTDAVLRRPLPVADADRLVVLWNLRDGIESGLMPQGIPPFARDSRTLRGYANAALPSSRPSWRRRRGWRHSATP